jgi:hypothetical protein
VSDAFSTTVALILSVQPVVAEPPRHRTKQYARKTTGSKAPRDWQVAKPPRQRTKQTARTGGKAPRDREVSIPRTISPPSAARWDDYIHNGSFRVVSPYLAAEWPDYVPHDGNFKLRVRASSTGAHLWGSFEFGVVTGVFKTTAGPPSEVDPESDASFTARIKWRGYEQGEGQMTFGNNNTGSITFSGGRPRRVEGVLNGSFLSQGKATFAGTAVPNMVVMDKALKDWKVKWRSINDRAYNAASRGRWGGWVEEPRAESPAPSDTSGGFGDGSDHGDWDGDDESDED